MSVLIVLHLLAAVVWVGGMFFAHTAMRPAAASLPPDARLALLSDALGRFFAWVWIAVVLLPVTGYAMAFAYFGGFAHLGPFINIMQGLGWLMILLFLHVFFSPFRRLRRTLAAGDLAGAASQMNQIRLFVTINLVLGLVVVVIAGIAHFGP